MKEKIPLVLLPGLLCDALLWRHQSDNLADIATPTVADLTEADSVGGLARAVLTAAPPRFALAGLSMGGYVAFEIMRIAADRVMKLALIDTAARPDTAEQSARRRGLIQLSEMGDFKGVTPRLLPLLVHPDRVADPRIAVPVQEMAMRIGQAAFARQQTAIMNRPDSRPDLPKIACPTLILCGRQDALTPPPLAEEMATAIPGARLTIVENSGHLSPLEQPEAVTRAMRDWLR
ncbi:MAG: alpha/beta fold hydrolase [Rhodospirillaceae bacterium]|nr:alpha/beta fold hydrolase [Rhodospirillaceae bacterium]